jgi:hypothetical protein
LSAKGGQKRGKTHRTRLKFTHSHSGATALLLNVVISRLVFEYLGIADVAPYYVSAVEVNAR